ncbi:MAG: hypothetical protein LBB58_02615 [Cellulomonadaceae bacterium]|jgi:hypothetical protein|nr:hypothetical protein [Cellulomonadaceae bacterium]
MENDSTLITQTVGAGSLPPATLDRNRAKALEALRVAESRTGVKCHSYRQRLDKPQTDTAAQAATFGSPGGWRSNSSATPAMSTAPALSAQPALSGAHFPVQPKLAHLFPQRCITAGSVISVQHGLYLLFGFLTAASRSGSWVSFVGLPGLGLLAASQAGLSPERVAFIPEVGCDAPVVVAALLDAMCVVVGPQAALSDSDRRRLAARARERGAVLFTTLPWQGAHLSYEVLGRQWGGVDRGAGWFQTVKAQVLRVGRGAAAAPKSFSVELPLAWP